MLTRQAIATLPPRSRFDLGRMPQAQETESLESLAYDIICRERTIPWTSSHQITN